MRVGITRWSGPRFGDRRVGRGWCISASPADRDRTALPLTAKGLDPRDRALPDASVKRMWDVLPDWVAAGAVGSVGTDGGVEIACTASTTRQCGMGLLAVGWRSLHSLPDTRYPPTRS
jgi:hypothetical protein